MHSQQGLLKRLTRAAELLPDVVEPPLYTHCGEEIDCDSLAIDIEQAIEIIERVCALGGNGKIDYDRFKSFPEEFDFEGFFEAIQSSTE